MSLVIFHGVPLNLFKLVSVSILPKNSIGYRSDNWNLATKSTSNEIVSFLQVIRRTDGSHYKLGPNRPS
uniref:Putative ovule protein n=1 Tax=Solanum chacoense TaxID=4108 RepID=A0A0V0GEJ5_SOLCH